MRKEYGSLFVCPGDCSICNVSFTECPQRGQLTSEGHPFQKIIEKLIMSSHTALAELLTPRTVMERWGSDIFQAIQALEILSEQGRKITEETIFQHLLDAIKFPMDDGKVLVSNSPIPSRVRQILDDLTAKIILVIKRKCKDECSTCCLNKNCTQQLSSGTPDT